MGMFGYFKIPDVILSLGSSQKLNWTHTFDTHCSSSKGQDCDWSGNFYPLPLNVYVQCGPDWSK